MENQSPRNHGRAEPWTVRLDRLAGELNAFLLVLAIGLAILDFTCFFAFKVRDALPSPARIEADRSLMAKPAAATGQPMSAIAPTKPAAGTAGW